MPPEVKIPHSKLPPDAGIRVRAKDTPIRAEDVDAETAPRFLAMGMMRLQEALGEIARRTENLGDPVDEYQTVSLAGLGQATSLSLQPTYEYVPEKIISVIVGGPPAATVTVILGDRQWPLVIPASGIIPIGPIGIFLSRSDPRQLTAQTPGTYFLELMGFASRRFEI